MNSDMDRPGMRHGRRIVTALVVSLFSCAAFSVSPGLGSEAHIEQDLATRVAAGVTDVPVVITLKAHADTDARGRRPGDVVRALRATAAATQGSVLDDLDGPSRRFWLVNAIATSVDAAELERLRDDPEVASVALDARVAIAGTASGAGSGSWGVGAIGAPEVWSRYGLTGTGVRVGSIDTGVDATNPELVGAISAWKDFVGGRPSPYDDNGHGTHTVGTMVARNVTGAPVGVAPGATAVVAKAMGADGVASGSNLLAAAQWMTDPDGDPATADFPTVINNSWTAAGADNEWFRPMVQAWVAMGIAPVFAVGNTAGTLGNPASYPESIAVGQLNESGSVAANSSNGVVSWTDAAGVTTQLSKPDLTAPGALISSTLGTGYGLYSGSSMASPHVAAAIALIRQARPDLTVDGVREILRSSADDRGIPGFDLEYGAGALNVSAAISATGVPPLAVALPQATTPVAVANTAQDAAHTMIRVLKVTRRGGRLIVVGRVNGPGRLRLTLAPRTPTIQSDSSRTYRTASRTGGRFSVSLPVRRAGRGRYVLVVAAVDNTGRRLGSTSRAVRIS